MAAADRGAFRIGLVCLGNICRSPMADVVLTALVERAGWSERVEVSSCGTGAWHIGEAMDPRAAAILRRHGYDPSRHRAQQLDASWSDHDLLLAMDADNLAAVRALLPETDVRLFRDLDPEGPGDVPDPYFGGDAGFVDVLTMVERTGQAVLADVAGRIEISPER